MSVIHLHTDDTQRNIDLVIGVDEGASVNFFPMPYRSEPDLP